MPAWRFLFRRAAWKNVTDFCEQFFRFPVNKTSAVESSSHAPSRASGRLSRGAAHFFCRREVDQMEEHLQKADPVQVRVGSMLGVMEISVSMETTRIRDSLVSLGGGWNGVGGTRGRGKIWVWRGVLCAAVNSTASRGQGVHCIARMGPGNLRSMG